MLVVGLPDKDVNESRTQVRAAMASLSLDVPPGWVIVNLTPADLAKASSHYDVPIALAVLSARCIVPVDALESYVAFGEVGLDGSLAAAPGALPAAMAVQAWEKHLICPQACGAEAVWAGADVIAAPSLIALINHFRTGPRSAPPEPGGVRDVDAKRGRPVA
jgi:magnesium chelatase family protein